MLYLSPHLLYQFNIIIVFLNVCSFGVVGQHWFLLLIVDWISIDNLLLAL